jgi:hypothetical protein
MNHTTTAEPTPAPDPATDDEDEEENTDLIIEILRIGLSDSPRTFQSC